VNVIRPRVDRWFLSVLSGLVVAALASLASAQGPLRVLLVDPGSVRPITAAYEALRAELEFDAVVLVDGVTDTLMSGDEAGLGTPQEDVTSLAAVSRLDVPTRLVVCIGFGVDAHHGVCHAHFLENVAAANSDEQPLSLVLSGERARKRFRPGHVFGTWIPAGPLQDWRGR